jgi:hypothetical protein
MAVGRELEDVAVLRMQQALEAGVDRVDGFTQTRVAVIERLAVHGIEDFGRDMGRAGRVEGSVTGDADHGFWTGEGFRRGRRTGVPYCRVL